VGERLTSMSVLVLEPGGGEEYYGPV